MSGLAEGQKFRKTALKVIASSIRKGNIIEQDGRLYVVLTAENIHPGKGTPVSQIEMRRIGDGVKVSERYKTTDQVEKATVEDTNFNYLYEDADGFHFMNTETYDQVQVSKEIVGSSAPYLQENMTVKLSLHDMNPVAIQLPQRATLEVVDTEPVTKGQTASSSYKPAILSNGVRTAVPPHIGTGTRIVVMTEDGSYVERAKDYDRAQWIQARRGAIALNRMAVRLLRRWLAVLCLLAAGVAGAAAEEFRTPSISAVRVEWRPLSISSAPRSAPARRSLPDLRSPASGASRHRIRARRPRWCN